MTCAWGLVWVGLIGCGGDPPERPPVDDPEPSLRVYLDGKTTKVGGTLVVTVEAPQSGDLELPQPEVDGLSLKEKGAARVERIGDRVVVTQTYAFTGAPGHYEVPSLVASWGEGHEVRSEPLWIDLDVDAPSQGELAEISDPSAIWTAPWGLVAGGTGLALIMAGGLYLAFRRDLDVLGEAPPDPPDVVALREWDRVRADQALSDYDKALALSRIFREYAEEALRFPATSNTTTETVAYLARLTHLPDEDVPRAKRLLRATDMVKYADAETVGSFFTELDIDLRAFVASTRPSRGPVLPVGVSA